MSRPFDRLEVLHRTPNEVEAEVIAGVLNDHGIQATTSGGYTSGFRAEAPGDVGVLVAADDLPHARELLVNLQQLTAIDWDAIDFGDPSAPDEQTEPGLDSGVTGQCNTVGMQVSGRRYQYGLALIIIVQTMFCVALAFWRIPPTADQREELALVMIVVCITIALIGSAAAGTVVIASNLDRARRLWCPIGKLLTIALTAILALMLLSAALRN